MTNRVVRLEGWSANIVSIGLWSRSRVVGRYYKLRGVSKKNANPIYSPAQSYLMKSEQSSNAPLTAQLYMPKANRPNQQIAQNMLAARIAPGFAFCFNTRIVEKKKVRHVAIATQMTLKLPKFVRISMLITRALEKRRKQRTRMGIGRDYHPNDQRKHFQGCCSSHGSHHEAKLQKPQKRPKSIGQTSPVE